MSAEAKAVRQGRVGFRHLTRLTDDTGLLEHCLGPIPRRREGYTTDDNARALWACLDWMELASPEERERLRKLADTYLSFLLWAQSEDGRFHNNFFYDRSPEPEQPSDDCTGRTLWALALARRRSSDRGRRFAAETMLRRSAESAAAIASPRGWAYALAACRLLQEPADERADGGAAAAELSALAALADRFERRLAEAYRASSDRSWRWFEPMLTYGNGLLPWALLRSYAATGRREALEIGLDALRFLIERMTAPQGWIRPIGNRGWCTRESCSLWDQQPLEAMKLALAAEQAYRITGEEAYRDVVRACRDWFYGSNDVGAVLVDPEEGACCDGLGPDGPNVNCGAESTLSYLLTEAVYARVCDEQSEADVGRRAVEAVP